MLQRLGTALGWGTVAGALLLTTGGVAIESRAEPRGETEAVAACSEAATAGSATCSASCQAPAAEPVVVDVRKLIESAGEPAVQLNTRGYNYSLPGRPPLDAERAPQPTVPEPQRD